MIMPTKHTTLEQSLLGFGSYLLGSLGEEGKTIDELWNNYQKDFSAKKYRAKQNFDNLVMTLLFLFSVNAIYMDDGVIKRCV